MKSGHYKVRMVDVKPGDCRHQHRLDFEVLDGESAGQRLSLHIDCVHVLEIEQTGKGTIKTTFDDLFAIENVTTAHKLLPVIDAEHYDALYSLVSALRVGQSVPYKNTVIWRRS